MTIGWLEGGGVGEEVVVSDVKESLVGEGGEGEGESSVEVEEGGFEVTVGGENVGIVRGSSSRRKKS